MNQRVALITGASQGLGLALAEALAADGWALVIDARRADRLEPAASVLAERTSVVSIPGDIADPAHRAQLVEAVQELGRLDLLVNNASTLGESPLPTLANIDLGVFRRVFEVNVVASLALTQALLEILDASAGTIVNVTSDAAVEPYETWGGYGSSKAAFEQLSAVLAAEQPQLRVLVVDPGDMRTEMHQDAFPGEDISDRPLPAAVVPGIVALINGDQPSGRVRARGGRVMTAVLEQSDRADSALSIPLDPSLEAHEPPEVWGRGRDNVRLLVSNGDTHVEHATFRDLPRMLRAGDALVVNTSATIPAAIDGTLRAGTPVRVHFSTEMPGGLWLVEAREPVGNTTAPLFDDLTGVDVTLAGGGHLHLFERFADSQRLWLASPHLGSTVLEHLARFGEPIRYKHAPGNWPLSAYQQIFGVEPGSAEMPSASRPFTAEIVVDLVRRGITIVPLLLHTGVSSLEAHEMPYPERYRVSDATAAHVNAVHGAGGRVIAAGTTVVRALETVTDGRGIAHPGEGWTELVVTPERGVRAVDGLLTGWHEPEATHLLMLEAIAGRPALERAYSEAHRAGYLWHEFGDSHLLLPERG